MSEKTLGRVYEMNNFLLQNVKTIFKLRKVCLSKLGNRLVYAYTVTLKKDHIHKLEELVEAFYTSCKAMLTDGENLTTDKKGFIISSDEFVVHYYIEAWKKSADKIAYIENGQVKIELLRRMSCEQAAYIFKKYNVEPFELINTLEFLQKHDNYADKYVALAKFPTLLTATQAAIADGRK